MLVINAAAELDTRRRQITGLAVPWNVTARVSTGQSVRFERDSIRLASHVAFIDVHDGTAPTGYLLQAESTHAGLVATFQLGTGPLADAALRDAGELVRTGLSVGVDIADPANPPLVESDGTLVFTRERPALLHEVSLLAIPAFDLARVSDVAASAHPPEQESTVSDPTPPETPAAPAPPATLPAPTAVAAAPAPQPAPAPIAAPIAPAPVEVPTAVAAVPVTGGVLVTAEPFPYTFTGSGHSMLRDYVKSRDGDAEAQARLRRASDMLADPSKMPVAAAADQVSDHPGLAPTLSRPDLWLPIIERQTPLFNSCTKVTLDRPNPFMYPATISSTGIPDATPSETANPTPGNIDTDPITVTPALVHGAYQFTRTLLDSASPAIDVVAAQVIQEAIARDIEAKMWTLFDTSADVAAGAAADGQALLAILRTQLATFIANRYAPLDDVNACAGDYALLVAADDDAGRPLFAPEAPSNAVGGVSASAMSLGFYGTSGGIKPAWAISEVKTTVLSRREDVIAFLTPLQSFRFEEKNGPELIEVDFRMYFVGHIARAVGVRKLVHT